jgi:hypothetical protein
MKIIKMAYRSENNENEIMKESINGVMKENINGVMSMA